MAKRLSIDDCERIAAQEQAAYEDHLAGQREAAIEAIFASKSAAELVVLWKTGRNPKGKPLSDDELHSLYVSWQTVFGCWPPEDDSSFGSEGGSKGKVASLPKPLDRKPSDISDGPLSRHQVCGLFGYSISTLDRMVKQGRFPQPYQVSSRRVMFQGSEVRDWLSKGGAKQRA